MRRCWQTAGSRYGEGTLRVLILSQHFAPEITACRFRIESFTRALVDRGHEVHVITAVPNHPLGEIDSGYRGRVVVRKRAGRLTVSYLWVSTSKIKSLRTRLANYGSFAAAATAAGLLDRRADVILATSPPLPVGLAGLLVALRHRAPWVFDVRDLWPKAAITLGELSEGRVTRAAERLERRLYAAASTVVTVTESFREHVEARAPAGKRIEVVPNGTTRWWLQRGAEEVDRERMGVPADRFVVGYAGNLGLYHGLNTAVDAAAELDEGYQLLLVGHGPLRGELESRAAELPTGRVRLAGLMTPSDAASSLRACDALLVSLDPSLADVLSSKLFDYCAIGRPVIVAAHGETRRVVEAADAALCVDPGSPEQLAGAIRRLREEPALRERLVRAGRVLAAEHLRERQAEAMVRVLEQTAGPSRAAS